jgi:hypothetical protein
VIYILAPNLPQARECAKKHRLHERAWEYVQFLETIVKGERCDTLWKYGAYSFRVDAKDIVNQAMSMGMHVITKD